MTEDLDPAAVEAAGRAVCRDGWDVAAERAVHIGSVRAALTAAYPIIAASVARATADAIADQIRQYRLNVSLEYFKDKAFIEAEALVRAHGRTPETDTTEATE